MTKLSTAIALLLSMVGIFGGCETPGPTRTEGPPSGFAGVPWGSTSSPLIQEFGPQTRRTDRFWHWERAYVMGFSAQVKATIDPHFGLFSGSYTWRFEIDPKDSVKRAREDALFVCDRALEPIVEHLAAQFGEPSWGTLPTTCSDILIPPRWQWPDDPDLPGVEVRLRANFYIGEAAVIYVNYYNLDLKEEADSAQKRRRL